MDNYSTPKKMKKLGDLFLKYKTHFKAPQATVEKAFIEAVEAATGYKISIDKVNYKVSTKTISLNISSLLKTELKLKQKEVNEDLRKRVSKEELPKVVL